MLKFPGKLDCTRIGANLCGLGLQILLFVTILCRGGFAQSPASLPPYPEVGWLAPSSYCNPYFGFRLALPADFKRLPIYLPVEPHGRHALFAMHMQRLDRSADLLISAFEDSSEDAAHIAAKARLLQARHAGFNSAGPNTISVHEHPLYRIHITSDTQGPADESSYFLVLRGLVVHVAIFSHEHDLAAVLESAVEHLEFTAPGDSACMHSAPIPQASALNSDSAPSRIYYGPALPTDLVESTLRASPGNSIPEGHLSQRIFAEPALGVRVELPLGWQPLPVQSAYLVTELMRDPIDDPDLTDRRRALFRACSRVVFTAADPRMELLSEVHPALAIVAMRQGCIPDMVLPATGEDRAASEEFATVMARSLGVLSLVRGSIHSSSQAQLVFNLDGTLPYKLPGEMLARRLSLRVSATASGPWLIFVYSVTPTHAAQRELESRITIGMPDSSPKE
jgi:hypothetical protein